MRTAVILPAYNEERTIAGVIEDFHRHLPKAAIIVVNNASSDRTQQIAEKTLSRLGCEGQLINEVRRGKAFAVQRAFSDVDADLYLLADADMTYPAQEARRLLEPIVSGIADMTVGDRHALGYYKEENKRPFHNFGNALIRKLINLFFSASLNDILSGYRGFSRRFVKNFPVLSRGFAIEAEITLHALDKNFSVVEIPVEYHDRPVGSCSKLRTYSDGFKVVRLIFEIFKNYRPLAFFGSMSLFFFVMGLAAGFPVISEYIRSGIILHIPLAILATGIMLIALVTLSIGLVLDTVAANNRFNYQLRLIEYPKVGSTVSQGERLPAIGA